MAHPGTVTADQLRLIISETLSPHADIRKAAEERLKAARRTPGHPLETLEVVANSDASDAAIRQAAAVHFKNTIKAGWDVNHEDGTDGIVISPEERNTIKTHLVQLMCTVPPQIQAQLSESISLIAKVDYPDNWTNLVPELVQQFHSTDPAVVIGVLKTANSLFKRFRGVDRSDNLYRIILEALRGIQAPLLALFKSTGQAVDALAADPSQLKPRFEALRLMCRIFYSLNYQDLPEFFEDHMGEWMAEFSKYLQYKNPLLVDPDEENESSAIDKLQSAIIVNLSLYADKDEEPFMEYLPKFTELVWNLLMEVSPLPKHDTLATTSIRFLSSLVAKLMHKNLFQDETILRQIVVRIVIPNLTFREIDEERFEDDPREFMVTEVEGSDSETRRKCSQDLLNAMCRQFETQTTAICSEHVASMLADYSSDPNSRWAAKDAAIHLMMGIAIRKEGMQGVSEVNPAVNVTDFFQNHILPELQDTNHSSRPVVKATSIKFVAVFRNQFPKDHAVQLLPLLIGQLGSDVVVVHTFAAYAIERLLFTKGTKENVAPKIGSAELKPFLEPLFNGLFSIVDNLNWNENDYVMKCIMRALATADQEVVPVTQIVISRLTTALGNVAKNPRNPHFNHYLFESIAVLVRNVCSKDPNATGPFEALLFEPFTVILSMDISEFTPYVFQLLAQLLEYKPQGSGLGDSYRAIFDGCLSPALWERRGNIPALVRLIQAFLSHAAAELIAKIDPVLGIFQKLLSSKATEINSFDILTSVVLHFPQANVQPRFTPIFQILLTRLQSGKTPRYIRLVTSFFALFVGKYGPEMYFQSMNALQPGVGLMLLQQIWNPRLLQEPPTQRMDAKTQVVGLSKLLSESPTLLADANSQAVWADSFIALAALISSPILEIRETEIEEELPVEFDSQFSQLSFARKTVEDPFPEVADPAAFFLQKVGSLLTSHAAQLTPFIQQRVSADEKLSARVASVFQQVGVALM